MFVLPFWKVLELQVTFYLISVSVQGQSAGRPRSVFEKSESNIENHEPGIVYSC